MYTIRIALLAVLIAATCGTAHAAPPLDKTVNFRVSPNQAIGVVPMSGRCKVNLFSYRLTDDTTRVAEHLSNTAVDIAPGGEVAIMPSLIGERITIRCILAPGGEKMEVETKFQTWTPSGAPSGSGNSR